MKEDIVELHAIARGQVQGVGFRATVHYQATQLGLRGTVCNLSDGNVEIYAQGTMEELQSLLSNIKQRFGNVYLEDISTHFHPPSKNFDSFTIVYRR